ncbi:MAG: Rieske 2Fe-2S domain-containing protein [Alphaproteobacteria bacterium]
MFLRNQWYAAALPAEIGGTPLARTICGEPIVFYRAGDGAPVAMEDRCPHRFAPLSKGKLKNGLIECAYHGLTFAADGRCVRIPGQASIPPRARVRTYPLVERWGWAWIWIGDAERADEALIPPFKWFDDPEWRGFHLYFHVPANWQLFADNLLDLSHTSFIHANSIGNPETAEIPLKTWVEGDRVLNQRVMHQVTPGPFVRGWGNFRDKIDRVSITEWRPPAHISVEARFEDATNKIVVMVVNPITPETETTTHFWMGWSRNFLLDDPAFTERARAENTGILQEDIDIIVAQQRIIDRNPNDRMLPINADAALIEARKIVDRLLASQHGA